jgi:1-acyl-sn-glycerol-3-phosphate acyltransferase
MIKHTLFRGLLGTWLESIGGLPIDRRASNGTVERVAQEFAERSSFLLVVTPEGTRRHAPGWKSGFYRIALAARVPVGLAFIDYACRQIGVAEYVELTGSAEPDWKRFADFYATRAGRRPRHQAPVVPPS